MTFSGDPFDRIDPRGIKRQVALDVGDCLIRVFVGPNGIFRFRSANGNALIRAIAFVRTIGVMRGPNEQRHVGIFAWQVVDGRISFLLQQ